MSKLRDKVVAATNDWIAVIKDFIDGKEGE